jgi:hypothetical protein
MSNEKEKDSGKTFIETLRRFHMNIESLRQFHKYLVPVAQKVDKKTLRIFTERLQGIVAVLQEAKKQGKKVKQKIIDSVVPDLLKIQRNIPTINTQILYKNIVITLCSYLEILISDLAKIFYTTSQDSLFDKNEITYADIKFLQTVEEVKELLIDKKIFELTNASFDDWLSFFAKNVDLKIKPLVEYYSMPIKEVLERRHIFVHNDGIVNKKYMNTIDQSYIAKLSDKIKVGEDIPTSSAYLNNSFRYIENFGELVTQ